MANPLATAMLSGNENGGLLGLDPSLLNASQDVQTGQGIENQALSTAPVPPGAALARALMAIPGAYVKAQGTSELAKTLAGAVDKAKGIVEPDTPIGKMLNSGVPYLQMQGLQALNKAVVLNSEPYSLGPADERYTMGVKIPLL